MDLMAPSPLSSAYRMEEGLPEFTESFGDRRCRFTLHAVLIR
jgi:hypothetical protein